MRIAICEHDQQAADRLETMLCDLSHERELLVYVDKYADADAMLFHMEDQWLRPDLIFLDVYLPGGGGITAAKKIRRCGYDVEIIFESISSDRAIEGYDVEAFHYILKEQTPPEKLREIFWRAVDKINAKKQEYVTFSFAGETCVLRVSDITYFEVNDRIVTVHAPGCDFDFYTTLEKIENSLLKYGFVRIHRSYIVSAQHVLSLTNGSVSVDDGTLLPVGRAYVKTLREMLRDVRAAAKA